MLCRNLLEIWKQIDAVKFLFSPNMCNGSAQIQARGGRACSYSDPVRHAQIQTQWGMLRHSGGMLKFRTCGAYSNSDSVGHAPTQWRNSQIQNLWGILKFRHSEGMLKFRPCGGMLKFRLSGACSDTVEECSNSDTAEECSNPKPVGYV